MKIEQHEPDEIKLEMTSMIDIVFQLLVFFIMTFKVVAMEGDFNIRMPLASTNQQENIDEVLPELITVELKAGENGGINSIIVDSQESFTGEDMYDQLTALIQERISPTGGDPEKAADTEVEFDIDPSLRYKFTVRAIEAVSGIPQPDGEVKKLIEKIKFKDNSSQGI